MIAHPQILGDDVMIVAVEYDGWVVGAGAQRDRLDVLGLDADGRLVVAELKRGPAPDTVDMQAIKYAAMASQFNVKTLAGAYASYRTKRGTAMSTEAAAEELSTHAPGMTDESLANPRVAVIAQSFPPSVISSVVWLANRGVTLSLTRFQPYQLDDARVVVTFSRLFPSPYSRGLNRRAWYTVGRRPKRAAARRRVDDGRARRIRGVWQIRRLELYSTCALNGRALTCRSPRSSRRRTSADQPHEVSSRDSRWL